MTAAQAVAALDDLTPNAYSREQKLAWLAQVEAALAREVFFTDPAEVEEQTRLSVGAPYDELYIRYIQGQIFLEAGEITRYNNAMALYNTALMALRRCHIRGSMTPDCPITGF